MAVGENVGPALEVADLGFSYGGAPALRDVTFAVRRGEFKILLGPNGAGKTTLFSLITRLYQSPSGGIRIDGQDLKANPRRALARMGVVFQQSTLDLDLTVRQNLLYHAALHGLGRRRALARIEVELDRLGMPERVGEKVRKLNSGHRRRVEVARALLHEPELLLLDEPTVGLDVPTRRDIVEHVHALSSGSGVAVLWATHLIDEVAEDDSVIVLHRGQIRADGRAPDVASSLGAQGIGEVFDKLTGGAER